MLKIKLTIADTITLSGMYCDPSGNKYGINRSFQNEENAMAEVHAMRERDCEFSLVVIRKV